MRIVAIMAALWYGASASEPVKVWVRLSDKGPAVSNPKAQPWGPKLRAWENLPVHEPYLEALRARGLQGGVALKWQNRVSGYIPADSLPRLRALPFVREVSFFARKARVPEAPLSPWKIPFGLPKIAAAPVDYGASKALMESLHVDSVHAWMMRGGMQPGKGVKVAVIDADFHLGNAIFKPMRARIADQYDFVDKDPVSVDTLFESSHGASCMSLIGGNLPGTFVGAAPQATFLLYRAEENAHERYVEEDYVAAAIERAVDSGAQVINISLGYRYEYDDGSPDLPFTRFDGRTQPSSIAALGAARRNVVVSVAMGNLPDVSHIPDGPTLGSPADADSIISVAIVDDRRFHCSYSCTGPTADKRLKPEVSSMGPVPGCQVNVADPFEVSASGSGAGTSYAAPFIAGIATLIRQIHPELTAMQVRDTLMKTADRADEPDSLVGHGLVDAWRAIGMPPVASIRPRKVVTQLYHQGGRGPFILPWMQGYAAQGLVVTDFNGRSIPVHTRTAVKALLLDPDRDVRTGVYVVRAVSARE